MKVFQNALVWAASAVSLLTFSVGGAPLLMATTARVSVPGGPPKPSPQSATPEAHIAAGDGMLYDAWIYPDASHVSDALGQVGYIHGLRAEFMHINDDGSLEQINQDADHPYGYSPEFAQTLRDHAKRRYATISGTMPGTAAAMQNPQTIDRIASFAHDADFGIELDWEDYGQWTPEYYAQYKAFVGTLRDRLAGVGHTLIVDGPPIPDENAQNWYQWKYEDIAPLTDSVTMMVYDNQYDTGAGNAIAPREWATQCIKWLQDKAGDKGVVGLAAYGYTGNRDTGRIAVGPSDSIARKVPDVPIVRNGDGELTATDGANFYDFSDAQTLQRRVELARSLGVNHVSIWSLGDNPWVGNIGR